MPHSASAEPFHLSTRPEALEDLRARLRATRWPDAPADAGWSLGMDVDELRALVEYWADGFDWPAQEAALNSLPHYRSRIDGLDIHFVSAPAEGGSGMPLLLLHGWPDSFWRYTKTVPLLSDPGAHGGDPADAFDVIVPDIPGFGYSDRPHVPLDSIAVARLCADLMTSLGYDRFAVAGGDIGSHVSRYLALDFPDRVIAVHRTDAGLPNAAALPADLSPEERSWVDAATAWGSAEGAYAAIHRTKPQTAAAGLTDSPAGLAAWIIEKLHAWSDGGLTGYTRDEILTAVSIYWFTGTIGSSMRMYAANAAIPPGQLTRRVEVPSGFTQFPGDVLPPPRAWLERMTRLEYYSQAAAGGHFAAFEQPEIYAHELREFLRPYRQGS